MIRVNQVKCLPGHSPEELLHKVAGILKLKSEDIRDYSIVKQSIDARKKPEIYYIYSVTVSAWQEASVVKRVNNPQVTIETEKSYQVPKSGNRILSGRPVVVGSGPAGLFCAYLLAREGYCPIVLERGEPVEKRQESVACFWESGELNTHSNVQFGEGGAGTFSDGKLNTLVKDKWGRNKEVLRIFTEAGAPESILYESKPHLGTDVLIQIVKNMRNTIIQHGGTFLFDSQVTDIQTENNGVAGVIVNDHTAIESEVIILAIGHSARDTFERLQQHRVAMEAKSFAVGFRVEHPQSLINQSQYGIPEPELLPPSPYKVTAQTTGGRGVYSFCMCPGGYVVNASSEEGHLAVNGMSYSRRDSTNANSAIIVSVTPADFPSSHPLAGIQFQRQLEKRAYEIARGRIPVQTFGEFCRSYANRSGEGNSSENHFGSVQRESYTITPCMKGTYQFADVSTILPDPLNQAFIEGMNQFDRIIPGFGAAEALVSGIESRTSSPVRILRDETMQSNIKGIYPCGEGAGYAGGITSAAMDGLKVAEEIIRNYKPILDLNKKIK